MANAIIEGLVLDGWRQLVAKGHSDIEALELLEKSMVRLAGTAAVLRAIAADVERESGEDALKARAEKARADGALRKVRKETVLPTGLVMRGRDPHITRVNEKIEAQNLADELERLRRSQGAAEGELKKAQDALRVRAAGVSPAERQTLEAEVQIREGLAGAARDNVAEAVDRLEKLEKLRGGEV